MTTQTSTEAEWSVQVLVEMEDGTNVSQFTREYVEGAIGKIFAAGRDIRAVISITNEKDELVAVKFINNPTPQLRGKAWS